ncbi:Isoleucine--tRNA ligase, partial [ANME-1 cluster archaeon GoMg2]|nr:Isoleucine--tRNA ligase [ANME-1 cluster archaeon GoMg2]
SQPVNSEGHFTDEVPPLEGMFVKDADRQIIEMMEQRGVLYKESKYLHSYPFCWRCGSPLLYYARESWFIAMKSLRDNLLANNEKINWYPAHLKHGRFGNFLDGIVDWALSRERFWGTPLNIWLCTECGKDFCVGSIEELKERATNTVPSDLHRPYIDEVVLRCEDCGGEMRRVKDVIDCWYDSGSAPFAQWHYPFETEEFKQNFPADFITEAIDQTRGWFYSLLAVSTAIFDEPPYLNVLSLGHILDENGVKMSKSKGNVVDITSIFDNEGADALRWYFFTAGPLYDDIRFSEQGIVEKQKKFLNTFWNSYFFFVTYAAIDEFNPKAKEIPVAKRNAMDKWIISRWNTLTNEVIAAIERFEIHVAARKIEDFVVNDLSNWYIRRSRRRFWIQEENFDKDCAYLTLYEVLVSLCKLLAPFVPFLTEHIYQNLVRSEDKHKSVHLCNYPSADESLIDAELEDSMLLVSKLVEAGRRARSDTGIKIRQPLKDVAVVCSAEKQDKVASLAVILKDELNVRELKLEDAKGEFAAAEEYKQMEVDEDTALFLNTGLDKELIEEGMVRDIVRRIQGMRKDIDLEYTAKISIMYEGDEAVKEAINNFTDYICGETLAVKLKEGIPSAKSDQIYAKNWKIDKKEVYLAIEAA